MVLRRLICALLFLAWTAEPPVELDPVLYGGHWRSPFEMLGFLFVSLPVVGLSVWQILLVVLAPVCLCWPGAFQRRGATMDAAVLISAASVAVTFLWGVARGGSAYNAYYQLWRFLAALLLGASLLSVIRTTRDLKAVGVTLLAAALVRATLAIYFYWAIAPGIVPAPAYMTTHDDSLLFVAGLVVLGSWALARGKGTTALAAGLVAAYLLYALVVNNRRLAWIEALLAFALVFLVLPRGALRRRMTVGLLAAAPLVLVYTLVGWGRTEAVFAPLRAFSTTNYEDASTLAREEEIRNLLYTLWSASNPLLGTGWGMPYRKVTS